MLKKSKVIIQLFCVNLFLSGVFCDVSQLNLSSTTEKNDVITAANSENFNIDPLNTETVGYSENPLTSRISLFENINNKPENFQLPPDGPTPRFSVSNGIVGKVYKMFEDPTQYYNTNGCGWNQNIRCHPNIIGNGLYRNPYNPIQDRPILDPTGYHQLGYNIQHQPNNLGTAVYTRPSYTGNLEQNIYDRPSIVEKPIYQYNGNLGQNVISQPSHSCTGGNIHEQVINRPSECCYSGNIGHHVVNQPSYYPPNNGYIYNKPCIPCDRDDTVEITNGYYYPKPKYPVPTFIPPIYSTTPQTVFPPATARIAV